MYNKFDIFLKADVIEKTSDGKKSYFVQGIGSTINKDRQGERLSEKALLRLEEIATKNRIPVFSQHEHSWENTLGYIDKSQVQKGEWVVDIALEDPEYNEKTLKLIKKKQHGTPIGLSIGGRVLKDYIDKDNDSMTRVIDDLELLELSIVGIPANQDGSVISYIAKSLEGENTMTEVKKEDEVVQEEVVEEEAKEEAPVQEEEKTEEVEQVQEEEKPVKEASYSKNDLEDFRKAIVEDIAKEIAKLTAVQKAVVVDTEKEIQLQEEESEEDSVEKQLEERLK